MMTDNILDMQVFCSSFHPRPNVRTLNLAWGLRWSLFVLLLSGATLNKSLSAGFHYYFLTGLLRASGQVASTCDLNDSSNSGCWCQMSPKKCPIHLPPTHAYLYHSIRDLYSSLISLLDCTSIFGRLINKHQNRCVFLRFQKYVNIKRIFGKEIPLGLLFLRPLLTAACIDSEK